MKITLSIFGKEHTFSEEELITILEQHFSEETRKMSNTEKPVEGEPYWVNPQIINRSLFMTERPDPLQEQLRNEILEAFEVMDEEPERYGNPFETLVPKRTWNSRKKASEHIDWLKSIGEKMADYTEQVLEWAQRIQNGESWDSLCNVEDTLPNKRLVLISDNFMVKVIGETSATATSEYNIFLNDLLDIDIVPLIIRR